MRADRSEAGPSTASSRASLLIARNSTWRRKPRQSCWAWARNAESAAPPVAALRKRAITCWWRAAPPTRSTRSSTRFARRAARPRPSSVDGTKEAEVIAPVRQGDGRRHRGRHRPTCSLFNMGNNAAVDFREMTAQHFEDSWRVGCFAGFLFGREAMRRLAPLGRGTVIFTGASGSLRGRPKLRGVQRHQGRLCACLVQSMAREFGPQGIHVAHAIIDGGIEGDRLLSRMPGRADQAGADGLLKVERDRRQLLAPAHPAAQRLDARDRPAPVQGAVLKPKFRFAALGMTGRLQ